MIADPILCYDVGYQVNDVAWAPYSSTVFALVTGDGAIGVFDIQLNKYRHICRQKVITSGEGGLNRIACNTQEPIVVVGDTTGHIHSLKLSPNLRKRSKEAQAAVRNKERKKFLEMETRKLDQIVNQVMEPLARRDTDSDPEQ